MSGRENIDWIKLAGDGKLFQRNGVQIRKLCGIDPPLRSGDVLISDCGTKSWQPDGRLVAGADNSSDLMPIPKPKVLRPFRDLEEFAAAVKDAIGDGDARRLPSWMTPGMCLAFVCFRLKECSASVWDVFSGRIWDWKLLMEIFEWTIDELDPVGRPFGVEE